MLQLNAQYRKPSPVAVKCSKHIFSWVSLTSWEEGSSLALVGNRSSNGVTIKIPYRVAVLLH